MYINKHSKFSYKYYLNSLYLKYINLRLNRRKSNVIKYLFIMTLSDIGLKIYILDKYIKSNPYGNKNYFGVRTFLFTNKLKPKNLIELLAVLRYIMTINIYYDIPCDSIQILYNNIEIIIDTNRDYLNSCIYINKNVDLYTLYIDKIKKCTKIYKKINVHADNDIKPNILDKDIKTVDLCIKIFLYKYRTHVERKLKSCK